MKTKRHLLAICLVMLIVSVVIYAAGKEYFEEEYVNDNKAMCTCCGYIYDAAIGDPENGVAPGTSWNNVPQDYVCPLCGIGKSAFVVEAVYTCMCCGYEYETFEGDPENGVAAGTSFEEIPDDWVCPNCGGNHHHHEE